MSAVDCINHVHLGYFNNTIGVYWPLFNESKLSKVTDNKDEDDVPLSPHKLLIGGGSGEHPAMHVINDAAVLHFFCLGYLFYDIPDEDTNFTEDENVCEFFKKLQNVCDEYSKRYTEKDRWYWTINQNHWPLETFVEIDRAFEEVGLKYPDENIRAQLSKVLTDIFGAIIIEKMPIEAIHDEELKELVLMFKKHKEKLNPFMLPDYLDKLMMFFDEPEPEMEFGEKQFGQNFTIEGNDINTGYSLEDWYRDFNK